MNENINKSVKFNDKNEIVEIENRPNNSNKNENFDKVIKSNLNEYYSMDDVDDDEDEELI